MLDSTARILDVANLKTVVNTRDGAVHAVNGVSFSLAPGELLGIVGESGAGKSVTMMSLMDLRPSPPVEIVSGDIIIDGEDVRAMTARELRALRGGKVGFIFKDPMTSLNPVFSVSFQLREPLREHLGMSKS